MPLDLQAGAPSEAMRKAFGLRGRFGMQIDETISPVATVRDLTAPPYREDGVWLQIGSTTAAVALQNSSIEFVNNANLLTNPGYLLVIDQLIIGNPNAVLMELNTFYKLGVVAGLFGNVTEYPAQGIAFGSLSQPTLISAGVQNNAGTANPQGSFCVPVGGNLVVPMQLLLRPTMCLQVVTFTQNVVLKATIAGRLFRDQP